VTYIYTFSYFCIGVTSSKDVHELNDRVRPGLAAPSNNDFARNCREEWGSEGCGEDGHNVRVKGEREDMITFEAFKERRVESTKEESRK
jgi:hypothetical protein